MTRRELNWNRDCKACLGSYAEASVDPDITNTNDARTRPCVHLGPSGNLQGSSKCLDIGTNKVSHRRVIKVLPASKEFIAKVEALGKKGARAIKKNAIKFLNRNKEKFDWDNDDLDDLEVESGEKRIYPEVPDGVPGVPEVEPPNNTSSK